MMVVGFLNYISVSNQNGSGIEGLSQVCCSMMQGVAVCCSVLQCVAVHCSALQCVAVWLSG